MMLHGWGRAGWVTMIAQRLGVQTWIDWGKRHRVCWEAAFGTISGHIKSCHWVMMCCCALNGAATADGAKVAGTAVCGTVADTFAWLIREAMAWPRTAAGAWQRHGNGMATAWQ